MEDEVLSDSMKSFNFQFLQLLLPKHLKLSQPKTIQEAWENDKAAFLLVSVISMVSVQILWLIACVFSSALISEWTFPLLTLIGQFGLTWGILVTFRITGSVTIGVTSWQFAWIWIFAFACSHYPEMVPGFQLGLIYITALSMLITRKGLQCLCVTTIVVSTAFVGNYFAYSFALEQAVGSSTEHLDLLRTQFIQSCVLVAFLHFGCYLLCLYITIHIDVDKELISSMLDRFATRDQSTYLLISTISHEIRSPLSAMIGSIETLRAQLSGIVNQKQSLVLTMAKQCGDVLRAITNNILDSGLVWCDKLNIQATPFDIRRLFTKVMALCKNLSVYGRIELAYRAAENLPGIIETDKSRLLQVLVNLVSNAIKHTMKGYVHITVKWEPDLSSVPANCSTREPVQRPLGETSYSEIKVNTSPDDEPEDDEADEPAIWEALLTEEEITVSFCKQTNILKMSRSNQTYDCFMPKADSSETMLNGEMVMAPDCFLFSHETEGTLVIEIIDSGEGISKEGLERIFDPFVGAQQVTPNSSVSAIYKSIGLGLAITRNIVREMGGNIGIKSEIGQGTIVTIRLPVTVPPQKKKVKRPKQTNEIEQLVEKMGQQKVLIVEDIHYNAITLKALAHGLQCECAIIPNGTDAVRFYETHHDQITAILMDICLPQLNGIDATKLIRYFEKKNELKPVPIFIVTADLDNVSKKAAFQAGANEFFEKPVHCLVLAKALQLYTPACTKIAFVDNDSFALDLNASIMASVGYQTVCISDPRDLEGQIDTEGIDVVFANSLMQPIDAIQLVQSLRKHKVMTPFVIVTGVVTEDLKRTCAENDVAYILVKPATLDSMMTALRATIK